MEIVNINEGWFYYAGKVGPKTFGWVEDGLDIRGVGINVLILQANRNKKIEVIVHEKNKEPISYIIDVEEVRESILKYHSFQYKGPGGGTKLGVFSKSFMKEKNPPPMYKNEIQKDGFVQQALPFKGQS